MPTAKRSDDTGPRIRVYSAPSCKAFQPVLARISGRFGGSVSPLYFFGVATIKPAWNAGFRLSTVATLFFRCRHDKTRMECGFPAVNVSCVVCDALTGVRGCPRAPRTGSIGACQHAWRDAGKPAGRRGALARKKPGKVTAALLPAPGRQTAKSAKHAHSQPGSHGSGKSTKSATAFWPRPT